MKTRWLYIAVNIRRLISAMSPMLELYGFISIPPVVVSVIFQEFLYAGLFGGIGIVAYLVGRLLRNEISAAVNKTESLVVAALSYLLFSFLGSLPFVPVGSLLNGFFEAMSGFTTTGLTLFDPDVLPRTLVFFRSYSQWIGGAGIIILSMAVVDIPVRTAFRLAVAESVKNNMLSSIKSIMSLIIKVYLILTAVGFGLLLLSGMTVFDSLIHVLSGISTGGFSSHGNSISFFTSPIIRCCLVVIMVLGATNFTLYQHVKSKQFFSSIYKDRQLRWMLSFIFLFAALRFFIAPHENFLSSIFHSVSSLTTTGYAVTSISEWSSTQKLLSALQMVIGGGDASTAGGIKLFRFITMVSIMGWFVRRSLLPRDTYTAIKFSDRVIGNTEVKEIFGFFVLYLGLLSLSTIVLNISGYAIFDSFFESASSLGTVGLSTGITQATMPAHLKALFCFNMWAGRLEIMSVLIVFNPFIWRSA